MRFIYLCGIDLAFFNIFNIKKESFIIFQGSFLNNIELFCVNLIFPVKMYTESLSSYINLEGRYRKTEVAVISKKNIFYD